MPHMQRKDGIGISWAKSVLKHGYQSDNNNPNITKAKVWNQKSATFEVIELSSDKANKVKGSLRGNMTK